MGRMKRSKLVRAEWDCEGREGLMMAVALLTPLPKGGKKKSRRDELIEQGLLVPATKDWRDFNPLPPVPGEKLPSQILQEMRDEERW